MSLSFNFWDGYFQTDRQTDSPLSDMWNVFLLDGWLGEESIEPPSTNTFSDVFYFRIWPSFCRTPNTIHLLKKISLPLRESWGFEIKTSVLPGNPTGVSRTAELCRQQELSVQTWKLENSKSMRARDQRVACWTNFIPLYTESKAKSILVSMTSPTNLPEF